VKRCCKSNVQTQNFHFRFLKSAAFEIQVPEEITEHGRYSPRFIEEISDEIDIIEDKKAPLFSEYLIISFGSL
jgi:hypothetical protein